MARSGKNLLSTPNKVLESPYGTYEDVKRNMENYDNIISNIRASDSSIIEAFVIELEGLLSILRAQELSFASLLGCNDANSAMKILNNKIDRWNSLGGSVLLDLETRDAVLDLVIARIDDASVIRLLQNYIERHQAQFNAIIGETVIPQVEDALTELFEKQHRFQKGRSLGAVLTVSRRGKGYTIEAKGDNPKLSQTIKRHLLTLIKQDTSNTTASQADIAEAERILSTQLDQDKLTVAIIDLLSSKITKQAMNYIKPEIENKGGYARYANLFVIQGYLGEVYWNAFMHFLFENKAWVIPVGDVKNIKGKSMAVDMLVNDIGFQIKRWSIKEGIEGEDKFFYHTNNMKMQFGTFLSSRAQMLHTEVGSIIARMFGSLSYNKPNPEKKPEEIHGEQPTSYSDLFRNLVTVEKINFMDLEYLFQTRLSTIIGISGTGGMTLSGKQYYNTFWAINDKIVPSSAIIEELISDIRAMQLSEGVSFKIVDLKDKASPQDVWNKVVNFGDEAMANRWNIEYETRFNLTKLLERAAQKT